MEERIRPYRLAIFAFALTLAVTLLGGALVQSDREHPRLRRRPRSHLIEAVRNG